MFSFCSQFLKFKFSKSCLIISQFRDEFGVATIADSASKAQSQFSILDHSQRLHFITVEALITAVCQAFTLLLTTTQQLSEKSPNISKITSMARLQALVTQLFFHILAETMTPTEAENSFLSSYGSKIELFSR